MPNRTPYQDRIVRRYYENRDTIALQKLEEMLTDLYLAEGKARAKLWTRAAASLEKLKVPPDRIDHLVKSDNPELLAKLIKEMLGN